ncbi:helix-turn-helix domain-containing protein [Sphingomonas aquatilis]|uniref:helix-turn-helix domain-containing protein n=1 Tax=Sphingomonas aquatilis TaxID=93063 RepID=UPI0023F95CDB|nr:hypothetical protein [Sphingomonas aquatilis]MCI4653099.1 hypothetical protein [Sphingomonas aquatilis]
MMTPGTYIRTAREQLCLGLEDVAARLDSDPHVPVRRRIDWLAAIEADREYVSEHVALALEAVLPGIHIPTLSRLQAYLHGTIAAIEDVPDSVLVMSQHAMLRHTGQPQTMMGLIRAGALARAAGWIWELPGQWRRPTIVAIEARPQVTQ